MKSIAVLFTVLAAVVYGSLMRAGEQCPAERAYTLAVSTNCADVFTIGQDNQCGTLTTFRDNDHLYARFGGSIDGECDYSILGIPYAYWDISSIPANATVLSASVMVCTEIHVNANLQIYLPVLASDSKTEDLYDDATSGLDEDGSFSTPTVGMNIVQLGNVGIDYLQSAIETEQGWYSIALPQKADNPGSYSYPNGVVFDFEDPWILTVRYVVESK